MSFAEAQFPAQISYGATGGPEFATAIVSTRTGIEQRNREWAHPRHAWDVATGIESLEYYHQVLAFFMARGGRLVGFRYKDWGDFRSSANPAIAPSPFDQVIGVSAGGAGQGYALRKTYPASVGAYVRTIAKPVGGTVRVGVNGVEQVSPGWTYPWAVNTILGVVTFTGTQPPNEATITAGFDFDTPARFDTDKLDGRYENWQRLGAPSIALIEVRL